METKPYRIQSPEDIAKDYGGNKQKIAQAMQLGIVDPTAGVLAGMFIDKMRAGQMQEMAPQQTVAQQIMAPQPAAPQMPAGGLGATPQAAPQMAPQMPPQAAPSMDPSAMGAAPPQGMAEGGLYEAPYMKDGGLSELPIPDTMFDEQRDGSYADGGLVAFAEGGMTDNEYIHYILQRESGGRNYDAQGRPLTSKRGALYAMQVRPDTARDPGYGVTPARDNSPEEYNRVGRELALALRKRFGDTGGAAAYNMGPGAYQKYLAGKRSMPGETSKYIAGLRSRGSAGAPAAGGLGATVSSSIPGVPAPESLETLIGKATPAYDKLMPAPKREARDALLAYAKELGDPEQIKKQANEDKWMTLAQIGFNMAASNSPYLLQAVGAAAAAALPGAKEAKREREAKKRESLRMYAEIEGLDNQDAKERVNGILDLARTQYDMSDKAISRVYDWHKTQFQEQKQTERTLIQERGVEARTKAAQDRADAADLRQNQRILRDQAEAARDRALAANAALARIDGEVDPDAKRAAMDEVAGLIHQMSLYNNQLKEIGGAPINWEPNAFGAYNAYARATGYVNPYHVNKKPQRGAPSSVMQQADAIIAGR